MPYILQRSLSIGFQCVLSYAGQIHHEIEDFVRGQIRQKLQIADGQDDPIKLKAMVKHWSQQMSAAVNREAVYKASRNVVRKASKHAKLGTWPARSFVQCQSTKL